MLKVKNNILLAISPIGGAIISLMMLLSAFLIPKDIFEDLIFEDYIVNETTIMPIFYIGCIFSFIIGSYWAANNKTVLYLVGLREEKVIVKYNFSMMFYLLLVTDIIVYAAIAYRVSNGAVINAILSANAEMGRGESQGTLINVAKNLLNSVSVYGLYWYLKEGNDIESNFLKSSIKAELIISIIGAIFLCVVTISRSTLVPLILEYLIVYGFIKSKKGNIPLYKLMLSIILWLFVIIIIFMFFSYVRGSIQFYTQIRSIIGYGPAAFNHLCYVLNGTLHSQYEGTGQYTLYFLSNIPIFHRILDFGAFMNLPSDIDAWRGEMFSTAQAGLNYSLFWVTSFGYYFYDLGYFTIFFVFITGCVTGLGWKSFQTGGCFGVVMYPFFASTVILWMTSNLFTQCFSINFTYMLFIFILEVVFGTKKNLVSHHIEGKPVAICGNVAV